MNYDNFVTSTHELYEKYLESWLQAVRSYWGGIEYRDGQYLKQYQSDSATPSDVIKTYDMDDGGNQIGEYRSTVYQSGSQSEVNSDSPFINNFYYEKLENVPVIPLTRLYVSEYNSLLFRQMPTRDCGDLPEVTDFMHDVSGEGESINEFMSKVDTYTTVYGVVWVSCIKPYGAPYARWRMHSPIDVRNWNYRYDASGELTLSDIVIRVSDEPDVEIFQCISEEHIDTIFVPRTQDGEEFDIDIPEGATYVETPEEHQSNYYRVRSVNELGYVPVTPIYQSNKIYNGIGHTPMFDISRLQRSVYNDFGELYSAISYGSHPVTVADQRTLDINQYNINAEPGAVIAVETGIGGESQYVFEFVAPPLDSITEIRELIEQKIAKMNQVAMVRSDDMVKASNSGAQIEQYDSKLEAFIRKKATSLENAEYNQLWPMWFDWQGIQPPEDMSIRYNRLYSRKGVEQEVQELNKMLDVYERMQELLGTEDNATAAELKEQLNARFRQLLESSYSENGL